MKTIEFRAMGCHISAMLDSASPRTVALLDQVPAWFETWEQALSRFRPDSELSQINRLAGEPFQASQTLWDVFQLALQAEKDSAGLVTPAILDALEAAGYDRSFESLTTTLQPKHEYRVTTSAMMAAPACLQDITREAGTRTLTLPAGLRLDFGGTAKGWAAHQAMRRLAVYGPALVNAGGDIAISGLASGGKQWQVGIIDPLHPETNLDSLALGRSGVATSGRDYRRWIQGGSQRHHIIDPRSGQPAETDLLSATVIAPSVMEAEVAAKVIFILGSQQGFAWLEKHPTLSGLLVHETGEALYSPNIKQYLGTPPQIMMGAGGYDVH